MTNIVKGYQYDPIMVYVVDWHQYQDQHNPKIVPYCVIKGWIAGFLIEDTTEHFTIALTVFDNGDVREVIVLPKSSVIEFHMLEPVTEVKTEGP